MRGIANRRLVGKLAIGAALVTTSISPALAQSARTARMPMLADYYRLESVGSPAISPDGDRVAFVRTQILEEENRRHTEIWLVSTAGDAPPVRLTSTAFSASNPRWSPDGKLLTFSSPRPSGSLWFLRMDQPAGEAFQIEGVTGSPIFSPDNRWIAFTRPTPPPAVERTYDGDFERTIAERFDGRMYDWMNYRFDLRG